PFRSVGPLRVRAGDPGRGDARGAREPEHAAGAAMSGPIEAVLLDYGHTLIYFDERPHSTLLGAYENVNRLLADTLEREVPAAQVMIDRVWHRVDAEIQRDYAAGREEEVEIAAIYDAALRDIGLELEPALIERVM